MKLWSLDDTRAKSKFWCVKQTSFCATNATREERHAGRRANVKVERCRRGRGCVSRGLCWTQRAGGKGSLLVPPGTASDTAEETRKRRKRSDACFKGFDVFARRARGRALHARLLPRRPNARKPPEGDTNVGTKPFTDGRVFRTHSPTLSLPSAGTSCPA